MSLSETREIWEAEQNLPLSNFFFSERLNKRAFKSCGTIMLTQKKTTSTIMAKAWASSASALLFDLLQPPRKPHQLLVLSQKRGLDAV